MTNNERSPDEIVGNRLAIITSWLVGINMAIMIFWGQSISPQTKFESFNKETIVTIAIVFCLVFSLSFLFTAATCLCSPYYRDHKSPPNATKMIKRARFLTIFSAVLIFIVLSLMALHRLQYTRVAYILAIAFFLPIPIWLLFGRRILAERAPF